MDCNTKEDSGRNETSIIAGNQNLFAINKMKPAAGRLPNNTRELMVTKSYLQRNKLNWKVGDTVTVKYAEGEGSILQAYSVAKAVPAA